MIEQWLINKSVAWNLFGLAILDEERKLWEYAVFNIWLRTEDNINTHYLTHYILEENSNLVKLTNLFRRRISLFVSSDYFTR